MFFVIFVCNISVERAGYGESEEKVAGNPWHSFGSHGDLRPGQKFDSPYLGEGRFKGGWQKFATHHSAYKICILNGANFQKNALFRAFFCFCLSIDKNLEKEYNNML